MFVMKNMYVSYNVIAIIANNLGYFKNFQIFKDYGIFLVGT